MDIKDNLNKHNNDIFEEEDYILLRAPRKIKLSYLVNKISGCCEEDFKVIKIPAEYVGKEGYYIRDCSAEPDWRTNGVYIFNLNGYFQIINIDQLPFERDDDADEFWLYKLAGTEIEIDIDMEND